MKRAEITGEDVMKHYSIFKSPIGELMLVADTSALTGLYFVGCDHIPAASKSWALDPEHPVLQQALKQLQEYFAGKRKNFSVLLRMVGTDFQKRIWQEIARIPFGETINYSELAKRAGAPEAIRAAGTSTGRNPISIIVPCHRVMGKNGDLCGFAGGLQRKRQLLGIENTDKKSQKEETITKGVLHRHEEGKARNQLSFI